MTCNVCKNWADNFQAMCDCNDDKVDMEDMLDDLNKRVFDTGACRDTDKDKYDFEGFLSPEVLNAYASYMHKNRKMKDGSYRSSDNWQKGIPKEQYMKSLLRHVMELWTKHRSDKEIIDTPLDEVLCAIMFNTMGMLYEIIQEDKFLEVEDNVGNV